MYNAMRELRCWRRCYKRVSFFQISFTNDKKTFDAGLEWFKSGLLLKDSDEKLRNHPNFVAGFNGLCDVYIMQ